MVVLDGGFVFLYDGGGHCQNMSEYNSNKLTN
jgi:hypothetical protein